METHIGVLPEVEAEEKSDLWLAKIATAAAHNMARLFHRSAEELLSYAYIGVHKARERDLKIEFYYSAAVFGIRQGLSAEVRQERRSPARGLGQYDTKYRRGDDDLNYMPLDEEFFPDYRSGDQIKQLLQAWTDYWPVRELMPWQARIMIALHVMENMTWGQVGKIWNMQRQQVCAYVHYQVSLALTRYAGSGNRSGVLASTLTLKHNPYKTSGRSAQEHTLVIPQPA